MNVGPKAIAFLYLAVHGVLWAPASAWPGDGSSTTAGLQHDVVFSEFPPLARNAALTQRLLTPLTSARLQRKAAQSGAGVREYPLDLANEKYVRFVPPTEPPQGYSLLVFIEPWKFAGVPRDWIPVLERHGVIFITAEQSDNTQPVYSRRIPLALVAAYNVMKQYRVNPDRVFIGGMSGGSRVALRMALAYPDVFHAALLHSSSDPIGTAEVPLPAPELLRQFQESTRLVYITGDYDAPNIEKDEASRASLRDWCTFDIVVQRFALAGHELSGAREFEPVLTALESHAAPMPKPLAACREHKATRLREQLQQVQELMGHDKTSAAMSLLEQVDAHFGGMAAPKSVELAASMNALD
ncbi:MAG: PHB depolymerase family esterase [Gammaproteobacteria bacterium]